MFQIRRIRSIVFGILCVPILCLARPCDADDFRTRITGADECLVIAAFGAVDAAPRTLVIWLHGDTSDGGPATSHVGRARETARRYADAQVLSVAMWRPGYGDAEGHVSGGDNNGRTDHYTAANMAIVADAIARLQAHYHPVRTIVAGHSGGAATTANLLGMRPGCSTPRCSSRALAIFGPGAPVAAGGLAAKTRPRA